jgi:hypothetical protein
MKICAAIRAWNAERFILPCIEAIIPCVDEVYISVSKTPWSGQPSTPDKTLEILGNLPIAMEGKRISVFQEPWKDEDDQTNWMFNRIRDDGFDYMALVDVDEFYRKEEFDRMRNMVGLRDMFNPPHPAISVLHKFYWKSPRYKLFPDFLWANVLFSCKSAGAIVRKRHARGGEMVRAPENLCTCYHLSYVRTDEEMRDKLNTFSHAHEIPKDWYEKTWKGWNPLMTNLHPIEPSLWQKTVEEDVTTLPEVVRRFL